MVVATILSKASASRNFQVNWPCMAWSITLYPGTHHLGSAKITDGAHDQTGNRWLDIPGPAGKLAKPGAGVAERLGEDERGDATGYAKNGVGKKFLRVPSA